MNSPTRYSPLQIRRKIEQITAQVYRLQAQNQALNWEIPSEQERILDNYDHIEMLTALLEKLERETQSPQHGDLFDAHAKAAVAALYDGVPVPPYSNPVTPIESARERRKARKFEPITKGHLTLVISRE